jgi:2-methylisocitrate lyase-like PEP mutase family enzyme
MATQGEKAAAFRKLHEGPGAFVIPNPWDIGSAKVLAAMGYKALATTSAGYAFTLGKPDGDGVIDRTETLLNFAGLCAATDLPVSADLQGGFGAAPETVAETIRLAAAAGLVGGSIEDASGDAENPIHDIGFAVERVAAAVEASRSLGFPFTLTARAENFLWGRDDLDDTIKRLQAFQEAGADVLYAPGLSSAAQISAVVSAVDRPVNVLMGARTAPLTVGDLARLGVRRVSVGSGFYLAAMGAFHRVAKDLLEDGRGSFAEGAMPYGDLQRLFSKS